MRTQYIYSYAILRIVPRVERGEYINAGVILWCPKLSLLKAEILLEEGRLKALDPNINVNEIRRHLNIISAICEGEGAAGVIANMPPVQRFGWLTATRSTIIQTSPIHTGQCDDPTLVVKQLIGRLVCAPTPRCFGKK